MLLFYIKHNERLIQAKIAGQILASDSFTENNYTTALFSKEQSNL